MGAENILIYIYCIYYIYIYYIGIIKIKKKKKENNILITYCNIGKSVVTSKSSNFRQKVVG